jgi:hypothetical protein
LLGGDASAAPTPARQGNSGGTADSGAGGAPSPPAQQRVPVEPRIINGQVAVAADFAFMVALLLQGQQFCGGTLLDETTVLTGTRCSLRGLVYPCGGEGGGGCRAGAAAARCYSPSRCP